VASQEGEERDKGHLKERRGEDRTAVQFLVSERRTAYADVVTPLNICLLQLGLQRYSRANREVLQNLPQVLMFLDRQIVDAPKFLTKFYKVGSPSNIVSKLGVDQLSDLGD